MKIPFKIGRVYTCITTSDEDRGITYHKKYLCVDIEKPEKFDVSLSKDNSVVILRNDAGSEVRYFGSVCVGRFSDDEREIRDEEIERKNFYTVETNREAKDIIESLERIKIRLNSITRYQKTLGSPIIDVEVVSSCIEYLDSKVGEIKLTALEEYCLSERYKKLVKNHALGDVGLWDTRYGLYEGTLQDIIASLNKEEVYTGDIHKKEITKL